MSEARELPPLFEGATHRLAGSGEPVKAIQWKKDGDHPKVERYPVERREFKGLLVAGPKDKFGLNFCDWIIEDAAGRLYVVPGSVRVLDEMVEAPPAGSGLFRRVKRTQPSVFEEKYLPIAGGASVAFLLLLAAVAFVAALFGAPSDIPLVLGVTHLMYYSSIKGQWDGTANGVFDLDTDTIKVSAHTNTYTPNQDTHDFFDDVTNEVTGTNYTAGGATLTSPTVTRSTGTVTFDGADIVWTQSASGFSTARKFAVYKSTGVSTTSRLFSLVTADADVGNVTGDLTIAWAASGISTWNTT
jgi:hypothetical protein